MNRHAQGRVKGDLTESVGGAEGVGDVTRTCQPYGAMIRVYDIADKPSTLNATHRMFHIVDRHEFRCVDLA